MSALLRLRSHRPKGMVAPHGCISESLTCQSSEPEWRREQDRPEVPAQARCLNIRSGAVADAAVARSRLLLWSCEHGQGGAEAAMRPAEVAASSFSGPSPILRRFGSRTPPTLPGCTPPVLRRTRFFRRSCVESSWALSSSSTKTSSRSGPS